LGKFDITTSGFREHLICTFILQYIFNFIRCLNEILLQIYHIISLLYFVNFGSTFYCWFICYEDNPKCTGSWSIYNTWQTRFTLMRCGIWCVFSPAIFVYLSIGAVGWFDVCLHFVMNFIYDYLKICYNSNDLGVF